jgi:hypothetical protein
MKLPPWTYSQLTNFQTCARQYYETTVAKSIPFQETEQVIWGKKVHSALEDRIKLGAPLPEGMTQWEPIMAKFEAMPGEKKTEQKFALSNDFKPAGYWDNPWTRGAADLVITHGSDAMVIDYKTGKRKLTDQLQLYAAYKMAHSPEVQRVITGFVWLRDRKIDKEVVTREEVPAIWRKFLPMVRKLEIAHERQAWPPNPGRLCEKYCPVTGCQFHGRRMS